MILALAHGHAAPAFNSTFFATAAVVIPVLFVALAVQGSAYETLVKTFSALDHFSDGSGPWYLRILAGIAALVLLLIAYALLVLGVASEGAAVYALYQGQAESSTGAWVLVGLLSMIIATAGAPALTLLKAYFASIASNLREPWKSLRALSRLAISRSSVNRKQAPPPEQGEPDAS